MLPLRGPKKARKDHYHLFIFAARPDAVERPLKAIPSKPAIFQSYRVGILSGHGQWRLETTAVVLC